MICLTVISFSLSSKKPSPIVTPKLSYGSIDNKPTEDTPRKSFDILGLVLLFISVICFLAFVQLTQADNLEAKSILLTICAAAFVGCFTAFCLNETRWAKDPMIHFSLLSPHKFGLIYSAQALVGIGQFSVCFPLSVFSVPTRGWLMIVLLDCRWRLFLGTIGSALGDYLPQRVQCAGYRVPSGLQPVHW